MRAFTFSLPCRAHMICSISGGLKSPFSRDWGVGLPYRSSNALNIDISLGANQMRRRAIRSNLIQFSGVSWHSLAKACFKICLHFSAFRSDWDLQAKSKVHFIPRAFITSSSLEIQILEHNFFKSFYFVFGYSWLINNAVIVTGEQPKDSVIHMHVSVLPQTPVPSRLPHNIEQSSLCYTIGPCWLSILKIAECTLDHYFFVGILGAQTWGLFLLVMP